MWIVVILIRIVKKTIYGRNLGRFDICKIVCNQSARFLCVSTLKLSWHFHSKCNQQKLIYDLHNNIIVDDGEIKWICIFLDISWWNFVVKCLKLCSNSIQKVWVSNNCHKQTQTTKDHQTKKKSKPINFPIEPFNENSTSNSKSCQLIRLIFH
jgi:hypothetical protein